MITKIVFPNTSLKNVFKILLHRLSYGSGLTQIGRVYLPGTSTPIMTEYHLLNPPRWDGENRLIFQDSISEDVPGEGVKERAQKGNFDSLFITGFETQINTVMIEFDYYECWEELMNDVFSELRRLFPDSLQLGTVDQEAGQQLPNEISVMEKDTVVRDTNKGKNIRDIVEASQQAMPLGLLLYRAAKDVIAMSQNGFMPDVDTLSPSQKASRIILSYACGLAMPKDDNRIPNIEAIRPMSNLEAFKLGLFDVVLPNFANYFLRQFPTPVLAREKFPRLIKFSDFLPKDTQQTAEQILNLTVEEANILIKAKPLVMEFKDNLLSNRDGQEEKRGQTMKLNPPSNTATHGNIEAENAAQDDTAKPEKQKQAGRYRLTKDEIKQRKKIVKDAIKIKSESPFKTWKQIANEMDVPERTLREYRHNPTYQ